MITPLLVNALLDVPMSGAAFLLSSDIVTASHTTHSTFMVTLFPFSIMVAFLIFLTRLSFIVQ